MLNCFHIHFVTEVQFRLTVHPCIVAKRAQLSDRVLQTPYLTYLLPYSIEQSPSWEANRFSASQEISQILWESEVHYRSHKLWLFRNMIRFHGEELLTPRPTPKLEDHPLLAVSDCLFNIFAATLHIWGRFCIRNLRTRHAVVTGTHLSRSNTIPDIRLYFNITLKSHVRMWRIEHSSETRRCSSEGVVTGLRAGRLKNRCLVSCRWQQSFVFCSYHAGSGVQPISIEWNVWCFPPQSQAVSSCSRSLCCTQCLVPSLKLHAGRPPLSRLSL
jgi:hypothetical protein